MAAPRAGGLAACRVLLLLAPVFRAVLPVASAAATCPAGGSEPLLWKATRGNLTAYLLATYSVPYSSVQPLPPEVTQALGCADVAFFELACSKADGGGLGHYLTHCETYPISDAKDAVALRLSPQDLANVQEAFRSLLSQAPTTCTEAAAKLKANVDQLGSTEFRTTLQTLYIMALQTLDPLTCQLSGGDPDGMEDALRSQLDGKPIWGLKDLSLECALYQGNNVEEDGELGRRLVAEFSSPEWLKNATAGQQSMAEVMKCGDLTQLEVLKSSMVHLPWLRTRMLAETNAVLAKGVNAALARYPDEAVLAVLNVEHFLNASGDVTTQGVPAMLAANGFAVERITSPGKITCTKSQATGPGAKQLGQCVRPIGQEQTSSCTDFGTKFGALLGNDTMYGRNKTQSDCFQCVNDTAPCTCGTTWENTSEFEALCTGTVVDGVSGRVMDMDLTRNPGSMRTGRSKAAKTVRSLWQNCYATSCDINLAQEIALRQWYRRDGSLTLGQVLLHKPGEYPDQGGNPFSGVPSPLGSSWSWWSWVLAVVFVALCVAVLVACFRLPKRGDKKKKPPLTGGRRASVNGGAYDMAPQYSGQSDGYPDNYEELKPLAQEMTPNTPQQQQPPTDFDRFPQQEPIHSGGFSGVQQPMRHDQLQMQQMQQQQQLQQQRQLEEMQRQQDMLLHPPQPQQSQLSIDPAAPALKVYDSSLLQQAMQMQQALGDAGAQAVQQMQMHSLEAMQQSLMQGMSPGVPQAPGSPFGSMVMPGLPGQQQSMIVQPGLAQASSMFVSPAGLPPQQGSMLVQGQSFFPQTQTPGLYGQPPSPTTAVAAGLPLLGQEFGGMQGQYQPQYQFQPPQGGFRGY